MRITVSSEGLELTPQLRHAAVSRLLSALGPFRAHIELVRVHLQIGTAHTQPGTTICDVTASLWPTGEVRARAGDARMDRAIGRASSALRDAVEREVARLHAARRTSRVANAGRDAPERVRHGNQTSPRRDRRERPGHDRRPLRIREYWRPPGVDDDEVPHELELASSQPR